MIKSELRDAALGDSHRENYSVAIANRFIEQAEAFIKSRLEAYGLEYTFTDADRSGVTSPVYTLPARVSLVRYLHGPDFPLDQCDENVIAQRKTSSNLEAFAVRAETLVVAGTPGAGTTLLMQYFGLPAPLAADGDTNTLLNDYPQLYIEATQIYIFKRGQDYESARIAQESVISLINEINRKMKKKLGGKRAAGPYNVSFRSSY
jgi:hypothetical protein